MKAIRLILKRALGAVATLSLLWLFLSLLLMLAVPLWLPGRGAALIGEALGREVRIQHAAYQPWRQGLVLEGLTVAGARQGQPPLLDLGRLEVSLSLGELLRGDIVLRRLMLDRPQLRLARVADGHYDIDDLLNRWAKPSAEPGPGVAIHHLEVHAGQLLFDDRPLSRQHRLEDLQLVLPFVSTMADDAAEKVQPRLSGRFDGVEFDSQAEATPFAADRSGRLSFKLAGLELAPFAPYAPAQLPWRLQRGRLGVDLTLEFATPAAQASRLKLSGVIELDDLVVASSDGHARAGWQHLTLPLADVQPLARRVALGRVQLQAPFLEGDWPAASAPGPKAAQPARTADPSWQLQLAGADLTSGRLRSAGAEVDDGQIKLGPLAWPLRAQTQAEIALRFQQAPLTAKVQLSPERLVADLGVQGLVLTRLAAWLPLPAGVRADGALTTQAKLELAQPLAADPLQRARLSIDGLALDAAALHWAGARAPALAWQRASLDHAVVDLGAHKLDLGRLALEGLQARAARDAQGRLDWVALQQPGGDSGSASSAPGTPWRLSLQGLSLQHTSLGWQDAMSFTPVALQVDGLALNLGPLRWPEGGLSPLKLQGRIGAGDSKAASGSLGFEGQLMLASSGLRGAQGQVRLRRLPLQPLGAYLDPATGLHLAKADLDLRAQIDAKESAKGWTVEAHGDAGLGSLALMQVRLVDGRPVVGEDLLSWAAMKLDDFQFTMQPGLAPSLRARELALDDAYARLIVDPLGRLNLRDLGAAKAQAAAQAPTAAASAAPVVDAQLPVRVAIEQIRLNRGLVDFNDRFIRPNYSARLSELQGSLGAFDTAKPAMAPLSLRGRVMGNGRLEVNGELRPGSPLALDVQAQASDIELVPLSAYAGKYAGYAIENGRLSTKLRYRIEANGQLNASNQIILNQLTFGDKVESPDATTLPVRFAVSLLKDSHGVIDVNLPVSGSINDPEFSVGGLVWRLILNLIGKALTAPFALFGGGDDGGPPQLTFEPGSRQPLQTAALERLAAQMADRPAVRLTLEGWADAVTDGASLKQQALDAELKAKVGQGAEAALRELYRATPGTDKPKNFLGLDKSLPPEQMRAWLLAHRSVDGESLRQLALSRATAVRDLLAAQGVPAERLRLAAPQLRACGDSCEASWQPHVQLSLDTP